MSNLPNVASAGDADKAIQSVQNVLATDGNIAAQKTANTLAYFGADKMLTYYSGFTNTKIGYLSSIAENVQTALDAAVRKTGDQPIAGIKTFSSSPIITPLTASRAVVTDGSRQLASLQYTDANTVSTLVQRDGSGNFSAGTITATQFKGLCTYYNTTISSTPGAPLKVAGGYDEIIVPVNSTGGAVVITIDTDMLAIKSKLTFKDIAGIAETNSITLQGEGGETIDGAATLVLNTNYIAVTLFTDGTNWFII